MAAFLAHSLHNACVESPRLPASFCFRQNAATAAAAPAAGSYGLGGAFRLRPSLPPQPVFCSAVERGGSAFAPREAFGAAGSVSHFSFPGRCRDAVWAGYAACGAAATGGSEGVPKRVAKIGDLVTMTYSATASDGAFLDQSPEPLQLVSYSITGECL